jgi:hypothetical protein
VLQVQVYLVVRMVCGIGLFSCVPSLSAGLCAVAAVAAVAAVVVAASVYSRIRTCEQCQQQ